MKKNLLCGYVADKLNVGKCYNIDQLGTMQFNAIVKETTKIVELIHLNVSYREESSLNLSLIDAFHS